MVVVVACDTIEVPDPDMHNRYILYSKVIQIIGIMYMWYVTHASYKIYLHNIMYDFCFCQQTTSLISNNSIMPNVHKHNAMHYILYGMNHCRYCNIQNIVYITKLRFNRQIHRSRLYRTFTRK